jgi:hypothetical protein
MAETEIIDEVYEETIKQLCVVLFQELTQYADSPPRQEGVERRFHSSLKAAKVARDRAKALLEGG